MFQKHVLIKNVTFSLNMSLDVGESSSITLVIDVCGGTHTTFYFCYGVLLTFFIVALITSDYFHIYFFSMNVYIMVKAVILVHSLD